MEFSSARFVAGWWLVSSMLFACGANPITPQQTVQQVCAPGTVYTCARGNCNGYQSCSWDGMSLTNCICDNAAGSGGGGTRGYASTDAGQSLDAGPDACGASAHCDSDAGN